MNKSKLDGNFMLDDKTILNNYQTSIRNEIMIAIFRCKFNTKLI
jgi:hypothetical protein